MAGILLPIGGAEDSDLAPIILKHFVQCCGGALAHIVVMPSASSIPLESAAEYERDFLRFGAQAVTILPISTRDHANDEHMLRPLQTATGVFLTGGDQMQLLALVGDTRCSQILTARFKQGMHIAGTSAGASAMSHHMIGFGENGILPAAQLVHMSIGLGLTPNLIVDQHFTQRTRIGRLMASVIQHPRLVGVGLDEDTALLIPPDGYCQIIGSGAATIVVDSAHPANRSITASGHPASLFGGFAVYHLCAGAQVALSP